MAYLKVYPNWLPYALMSDKRGFISKRFGTNHTGVDSVGNVLANKVCAVMDGTVTESKLDSGIGNVVKWKNGNIEVAYYHLASRSVNVGDKIENGKTVIGVEGSTGTLAKGKHLHVSIWINGKLVNPEEYLCGAKTLVPVVTEEKEDIAMVRDVIRIDLNLRGGAGVNYSSYGFIPKGSLINIVDTTKVGDATWGKTTVVLANGKTYTGWCNIGNTWSTVYTGAVKKV